MRALNLYDELNALGIKFEPIGFVKAPSYPYGTYIDDADVHQPDDNIGKRTIVHRITIEVYDCALKDLEAVSKRVDQWLNGYALDYTKRPRLIVDEDHYCMTYTLQYTTKERNETS